MHPVGFQPEATASYLCRQCLKKIFAATAISPRPNRREAAFQAIPNALKQAATKYEAAIDDERERRFYQDYQAKLAIYLPSARRLRELLRAGKFDESLGFINGPITQLGGPVDDAVRQDVAFNTDQAEESARRITEQYQSGRLIVVATVLVAALTACRARSMTATVGQTRDQTEGLASSAEAVSTGAVRSNIAGVSEAAADTGAAATQVLGATGQLSRQADDLSREVTGLAADARAA